MNSISAAASEAWATYTKSCATGLRGEALVALDRFLAAMQREPEATRTAWVDAYCAAETRQQLRFPLFRDLIFPSLRERWSRGDGHAAFWLATFAKKLYSSAALWKQVNYVDEIALLESAVTSDRVHPDARRQLLEALASALNFAVHEVPRGVLAFRSMNGAFVEQCDVLLLRLEQFKILAQSEDPHGAYAERIRYWGFHFSTYRKYLSNREGADSYREYLSLHGHQDD